MPAPPSKDIEVDLTSDVFSPVGDETRTVGSESVEGFIHEGNDIPTRKKHTLARYLGKITAGNDYPVSADSYSELSITGPTGAPTTLDTSIPDGQKAFLNQADGKNPYTGGDDVKNDLGSYSQSGGGISDSNALSWTQENLSKGKVEHPRTYDGNSLLRYVSGQPPAGDGKFEDPKTQDPLTNGYTSQILKHNRFTPASPAATTGRTSGNKFISKIQTKFGVYDPNAPNINPEVMDKIGPLLSLRAAGELGAENQGYSPPDSMNFKTILPGTAQLGIKRIDSIVLEARDALAQIDGGVPSVETKLQSDFDVNTLSFGQINTYADPFSGLLPLGMSALAIALILAAQISIDLFTSLMNLISTASSSTSTSRDTLGRHILGKSYTNPGQESGGFSLPLPARLFGIERTQHVYSDAVTKGLEVFFDVNLGRTVVEPGFFVIFLRSILSSASGLVRKVRDIFGSGNPFSILNAVVGFLDAIRSSKLIAAMNVFAHVGDQALVLDESNPSDPNRPSTIDDISDGIIGYSAVKSREKGSLKLAWRSSTAPLTMLLPLSLRSAGVSKSITTKLAGMNKIYGGAETMYEAKGSKENRIPLEIMRKIESRMEAEYIPFYFHDTRTNELIGFHAFLTALTDNYSVAHDTVDAYGRIDPIKIYKNTTRSITLSFMVVATDEEDFDHMWMKINKLLTLVYPQWSEGLQKRTSDGNKFIQPFSQVPAASPLFRLRIGDVIKSNYSRFALKRIFGYGSSAFSYKDKSSGKTSNAAGMEGLAAQERSKIPPLVETFAGAPRLNHKYLLRAAPSSGYLMNGSKTAADNLHNRDLRRVTVIKVTDVDVTVSDDSGSKYRVLPSDLIILRDEVVPGSKGAKNGDSIDKSFFSPGDSVGSGPDSKANTIVRSFETAMSKGLACIINSMNFNWMESGQWETEIFGSKAPKMVKVDLTLTPFHDITPGLDAYGANRAPVYNVGQFANQFGDDDPDGEEQFQTNKEALWRKK